MPSPESEQLTRAHRRRLALLAVSVQRRAAAIARGVDPVDVDAWWRRVNSQLVALVARSADVTAAMASGWLAAHAAANGVEGVEAVTERPAEDQIETSLLVTGPVAWKQNFALSGDEVAASRAMQTRLSGSVVRLALEGDRRTTAATIWGPRGDQRIAGWRRVLGPNPCAWCAMVASRGAVYRSRATAAQQPRSHNHDHCKCTHEPLYEHEPEPASVGRLRHEWSEVTAGHGGEDAIAVWSRHWAETRTVSGF